MRWVRAAVATAPFMDLLGAIVIPLLLLYARDQIKAHQMTPGIFLAFLYAMFNAYMPVKRIGQVYQQFQYAQGASMQSSPISTCTKKEANSPVRAAFTFQRAKSNSTM